MATKGIDFSKVNLCDALDLAILIDEEAAERYEEFSLQLQVHHTPEAAVFFHRMAEDQGVHADELRERRTRLFPEGPRSVPPSLTWGVKAPDYDEVRAFMTLRQAVETVVHAEEKADRFWTAALDRASDPEARALFRELHEEEVRQEERMKCRLATLPPDPGLCGDDVADEPTAH